MKYIDTDKLIAEIDRRISSWSIRGKNSPAGQGKDTCVSRVTELSDLRSFVISLQQEQPEPTCKTCGFYENNCPFIRGKLIPYPNKVCKDYTHSVMKEQEQLEAELEKELIDYYGRVPDDTDTISVARHFYELGLNARKEE